ncbi:MAG TPA: hypothetical protein ENK43_14645 [Planctomycetes bacterium]|nr:hypothetical protein [Planctomycetota bacterium]
MSVPSPRLFLVVVITALFIPSLRAQAEIDDPVIQRSIEVLLEMQEGDNNAEWPYEGVYRVGGKIPIGYRVGGTSIAATALLLTPGYAKDAKRQEAVGKALAFVLTSLEDPRMQKGFNKRNYDVRGWGHAYALLFLLRLEEAHQVPKSKATQVKAAQKWLVKTLQAMSIPESGGWNYSLPRGPQSPRNAASPFMTGPTLQALFLAKSMGLSVNASIVKRSLDALERGRTASGGYAYGSPPTKSLAKSQEDKLRFMHKKPGSVGRMCVAEATLALAGRGDQKRLKDAVDSFFKFRKELVVRKQKNGTHIPPYGVAPYYFVYAHHYAAQAIELVTDETFRKAAREKLRKILLSEREKDGGWNDRVFARSRNYGTAFGMMALQMARLPAIPSWQQL